VQISGGAKNVPNFGVALCNTVIKINEVKSTLSSEQTSPNKSKNVRLNASVLAVMHTK